ncbi:MAG: lipoyl protein ligase domain-containing protein [Anaerolineae bacterium]
MWEVFDTGVNTAEENMRIDAHLLETIQERAHPLVHFYEWETDSATYGHFIDPEDFLHLEEAARFGIALARRPTGGGIIFHSFDFAFSVLMPKSFSAFSENTLENYAFVNRATQKALSEFLGIKTALTLTPVDLDTLDTNCKRFCMARPTKYDVMLGGQKVAGAAQRRSKKGLLHQGSISLLPPSYEKLGKILKVHERVLEGMQKYTKPLLGKEASRRQIQEAKCELRQLLAKHLQ